MGLMKLLAVGRSIGRFGNDRSPFKMTQQSLLPKFGSVKAPEQPARGSGEKRNQAFAQPAQPAEPVVPANAATGNKTMNAVQVEPTAPAAAAVTAKPVADRPAFPRGRWTLFRNPFAKSGKAKSTATPVQTELLLDSVKPVRNDLSDSDLEVVRVQPKPAPVVSVATETAAAPLDAASAESQADETDPVMWSRIKNQFLGAGKS